MHNILIIRMHLIIIIANLSLKLLNNNYFESKILLSSNSIQVWFFIIYSSKLINIEKNALMSITGIGKLSITVKTIKPIPKRQ